MQCFAIPSHQPPFRQIPSTPEKRGQRNGPTIGAHAASEAGRATPQACEARLFDLAWPGQSCGLGSSLSEVLRCLLAHALARPQLSTRVGAVVLPDGTWTERRRQADAGALLEVYGQVKGTGCQGRVAVCKTVGLA
jgi:hypothetical protein